MKKLVLFLLILGIVNCEINQRGVLQYENYAILDMNLACLNYQIGATISESCEEQLTILCENETLLLTMIDATSKFPYSGLKYTSGIDFGNFDQCMTVDYTYEGGRILGTYCLMGLIVANSDFTSVYTLAVCKPNGCTAQDLNAIYTNVTGVPTSAFNDYSCQNIDRNKEYSVTDIVTISIFSVCILLMVISSMYDFYLHQRQLECPHQIYLAFSVITNGKKLLHVSKQSKEQISTFHGLRVISIMWVIAGHALSIWSNLGIENLPDVTEWQSKMSSVYIYAADLSVDTFFFISGFLLAYQYLKQKPKPFLGHVKTIPSMYLYRYLRLTPALGMVFLVVVSLMKHIGSGPLWPTYVDGQKTPCDKYWWTFFLYIQNYYNYDLQELCLVPTWYLSADMQMFLISPLIIIPVALLLQKSKGFKISMAELFVLNLFFTVLPLATKLIYRDYTNTVDTHSRLIDYYIGFMLAVFMRVNQNKPFLYMIGSTRKSMINLITWIVILLGMFTVFICYREIPLHHGYESNAIFSSLMRPAWCIGLSWIVYSSHLGYGGIVNWLLSRPIFQIWGRLTYCMYLLHMPVILMYLGTIRTRWYFSDYNAFYVFCGHFAVTLFLATFWTLAFESPIITIEKIILGRQDNKKKESVEPHSRSDNTEDGSRENKG